MYKRVTLNRQALFCHYKMADAPQIGGLTWHNVLHVILLFPPLLLAQAYGGGGEKYRASEGDADC